MKSELCVNEDMEGSESKGLSRRGQLEGGNGFDIRISARGLVQHYLFAFSTFLLYMFSKALRRRPASIVHYKGWLAGC